jgi:hypothetical protein
MSETRCYNSVLKKIPGQCLTKHYSWEVHGAWLTIQYEHSFFGAE